MESPESRSDIRSLLVSASPSEIWAAIKDSARIARWWGPDGFTNTIHTFEFVVGGKWLFTMHGPDGKEYPNESRFVRIEQDRCFSIEHLNGHHFILTLELVPQDQATLVKWQQTFDTQEKYAQLASFVATANQQNLEKLAVEVLRAKGVA